MTSNITAQEVYGLERYKIADGLIKFSSQPKPDSRLITRIDTSDKRGDITQHKHQQQR